MKSLFFGISLGFLLLQGCSDNEDKAETTTTTTTTTTSAAPTSSSSTDAPTTTTPTSCMFDSPQGFAQLMAEKDEHGFYLKSSSCEYYPTFKNFADSKLANAPERVKQVIVHSIFSYRASIDRDGTQVGLVELLEELLGSEAAELVSMVDKAIQDTPEEEAVDTVEVVENANKSLEETLTPHSTALLGALLEDKIMDIKFGTCEEAINMASAVFGMDDPDTLCNPNRPSLPTDSCTLNGNSGTVVLDRQEGWMLTSFTCDNEENAEAKTMMMEKMAMFPAGNIFGDFGLHYITCEGLEKYGMWANEADAACFINMASCSKASAGGHFNVTLDWDTQHATGLALWEKSEDMSDDHSIGVNEHPFAAELKSMFGLEQPKLREMMSPDEKAHAAYMLNDLTCTSYPTLKEEFMKYNAMPPLGAMDIRYSSCDNAESDVKKALGGWDLDDFCGEPADAAITQADTSCALASPNGMMGVDLMWNSTTTVWEASSAMCETNSSESASSAAGDYISKRLGLGDAFAAAFKRMSCDMIKTELADHILYEAAIGCLSEMQTDNGSGSSGGDDTGSTRILRETNELPASRVLEISNDALLM